ncbi:MAG: HAD family phosphatase [Oscillospiraceae bacterium]|nr:HAD family phosphatase [Oscillospiraceae bacterium]
MIENIVFDMGNVLVRFDPELFMDRLSVSEADRPLLRREVFRSLEWAQMDRGSLTDEEAVPVMCRRVPTRLHETVRQLVLCWDQPIVEIEGSCELVRELKELGYGLWLLSNASVRQHVYWERVRAKRYFDGTLISADVGILKPQPEMYSLFFKTFGLRPETCFFIDDNNYNIEGSLNSGMRGAIFHGDMAQIREKLREVGVPVHA